MKLRCYREQHSLDGVSVLSLSWVDVPASEVLEHRIADVTSDGRGGYVSNDQEESQSAGAPQRFRYRVGEGAKGEVAEAEGMILGQGDASLVYFLEHRYVPDDDSGRSVDRLILQVRRGEIARADWLRVMEEEILGERNHRNRRRMHLDSEELPLPVFVGYRHNVKSLFDERYDASGRYYLRSCSDETPLALVTPFEEKLDCETVPRWRFAIMGEHDEGFGCWDGRRYRMARQFNDVPDTLRRSLDRDGQVVIRSKEWFVPLPDLRPEFLIRVPYASEIFDIVEAGPPPPLDEFKRPSFLLDTRRPVVLRDQSELKVVDDPAHAIAVVTRCTTRGAYVPSMPPAPVSDVAPSPEGQSARYLAGCWLR